MCLNWLSQKSGQLQAVAIQTFPTYVNVLPNFASGVWKFVRISHDIEQNILGIPAAGGRLTRSVIPSTFKPCLNPWIMADGPSPLDDLPLRLREELALAQAPYVEARDAETREEYARALKAFSRIVS